MGRLGVAIYGLGRAGQIHLKNVVQNYELQLLYVVDFRVDHCKSLLANYNQDQCVVLHPDDQDTALNDSKVDFVMICTTTGAHELNVLDAVKAGKPVFCEKPIAADDESTAKCYDMAEAAGVPLFCSFNRRYDPSLRKLFKNRGDVGQIQMVKSCARDAPFPPVDYLKVSGGVFHDCLVHDIDLICWVVGAYPKEVFASAHSFIDVVGAMDDVDTVAAVMKFESGVIAVIDTSRDAVYGYDQRLEVFGSKGMLLNQNQRPNNLTNETNEGQSTGLMYQSFNDRYELSYIEALKHFIAAVRGEEQVEITKEIALNVSKIASALEQSSRSEQQVKMVY